MVRWVRRSRSSSGCMISGRNELDERDLRGRRDAHRGAPVPRAAAHVDVRVPVQREAGDIRLIDPDQKVPRENLASVRMAAELEAHAARGGFDDLLGLVGEEDQLAAGIAARQGAFEVRAMATAIAARAPVVHARQVKAELPVADADMFVAEYA